MGDWDSDYRYEPTPLFEGVFICHPFSQYSNPSLESGDQIIMPPSAINQIMSSGISFPLIFRATNPLLDGAVSHCAVLLFDSEEGFVYMPEWMMQKLKIQQGGDVVLRAATLASGYYMKLRPHVTASTEISSLKEVLEHKMRKFSCLSKGDTIMIKHHGKEFYLDVLEVRPGDDVSLINIDCEVEFAEPLDYKQKDVIVKPDFKVKLVLENVGIGGEKDEEVEEKKFRAFSGNGKRLDDGECSAATMTADLNDLSVEKSEKKADIYEKSPEDQKSAKPFSERGCVLGGA